MEELPILLTNCRLSPKASEKLNSIINQRYALRDFDEGISVKDGIRVQIMLVDNAFARGREMLAEEFIRRLPNLKIIQSSRAGVDAIEYAWIPENVIVCGNIGAYADFMAEHIFGMIISLARSIDSTFEKLKQGRWEVPTNSILLKGKKFLAVGAGGIGQASAKIAKCLGMETIGVNTSGEPAPHFDRTVKLARLDEVLGEGDVVLLSIPLTVKTFHLIDSKRLSEMKKNCILVNVARGYVIEEAALYNHMKSNLEFRCALDVWWHYPDARGRFNETFPFFEFPNFLASPHNSGVVPETPELSHLSAIENIGRFVRGEPLKGIVDRREYLGLKALISSVAGESGAGQRDRTKVA